MSWNLPPGVTQADLDAAAPQDDEPAQSEVRVSDEAKRADMEEALDWFETEVLLGLDISDEDVQRYIGTIRAALRSAVGAPRGQTGGWPCRSCGAPAVCFGDYEGAPSAFACGDCCGHGNEDGHCIMIRTDWPELPDVASPQQQREHGKMSGKKKMRAVEALHGIKRDESTPEGKRVWEAVERAAQNAPDWIKRAAPETERAREALVDIRPDKHSVDGVRVWLKFPDLLARGEYAMRSCHKCNAAHEHLTNAPDGPLIVCFACGHWYFKGVDLTEIAEQEQQP